MALPQFGQVSASTINLELNRPSTAQLSIDSAENGVYGNINQNSNLRPSSSNPAAYSEWWGYNHGATGQLTSFYNLTGNKNRCLAPDFDLRYHNGSGDLPSINNIVFNTSVGNTFMDAGLYTVLPFGGGSRHLMEVVANGVVSSIVDLECNTGLE